jgi:hypothetical protein
MGEVHSHSAVRFQNTAARRENQKHQLPTYLSDILCDPYTAS